MLYVPKNLSSSVRIKLTECPQIAIKHYFDKCS
jgi:hypothetical protein